MPCSSWFTSPCKACLSDSDKVELLACTASSRMRWIMPVSEPIAPSATCTMEMPSFTLRTA